MAIRIVFFEAKVYDRENFAKVNENFGFDSQYKLRTDKTTHI